MIKEPMLAAKEKTLELLVARFQWPVYASPKLDGIRAIVDKHEGGSEALYSRKLKLLPNKHCQMLYSHPRLFGLDGELIVGKPNAEDVFRVTDSGVTTHAGEPDVTFYTFDDFTHPDVGFLGRYNRLGDRVAKLRELGFKIKRVPHVPLKNIEEVRAFHDKCILSGYEGSMYRSHDGLYKFGRSTSIQGWLFKHKEFDDAEAEIVGFKELTHNDNPQETNELGRSKRSSHKENKRAGGTLGAFICRTPEGIIFNVGAGPGLTAELRAHYWSIRKNLLGRFLKYTFLKVGVKDRPRHPQYHSIRAAVEM